MAFTDRIYFNGVFGALGGLMGWMLFGIFGDNTTAETHQLLQQVLGGALIGGSIGYFVVSVDAIRDRSLVRFCRLACYGVVLGAMGGAIGLWCGEQVNFLLIHHLAGRSAGAVASWRLGGRILARGLGWLLLGIAIGITEGIVARSRHKLSYGMAGGTIGGLLGGVIFGVLLEILKKGSATYVWGQALGLLILGACIGSLTALVQSVFQPASLKVLCGWQEGREYALVKNDNILGRDEHADIALFRDMKVGKQHAIIRRQGNRYLLLNNDAPPGDTRVNNEAVPHSRALQDGDRIQLGQIVLQFQIRAERSKSPAPRRG